MRRDNIFSVDPSPAGTPGGATTGIHRFFNLASSHYVAFRAYASLAVTLIWTWPQTLGVSGQAMLTDGLGNLYWGGGTSGGAIAESHWITAGAPAVNTTLAAPMLISDVTADLASVSGLPAAPYLINVYTAAGAMENMLVTGAPTITTVPVTRAQNGTAATAHASGEVVRTSKVVPVPTSVATGSIVFIGYAQDATGYRDNPIFPVSNYIGALNTDPQYNVTGVPNSMAIWTLLLQPNGIFSPIAFKAGEPQT